MNHSNKFKNIFFPLCDMDMLAKSNRQEWLFPMYMNIEFSTDTTTAETRQTTQRNGRIDQEG